MLIVLSGVSEYLFSFVKRYAKNDFREKGRKYLLFPNEVGVKNTLRTTVTILFQEFQVISLYQNFNFEKTEISSLEKVDLLSGPF